MMNNHNPESDFAKVRAITTYGIVVPPQEIQPTEPEDCSTKAVTAIVVGAAVLLGAAGYATYKVEWENSGEQIPVRRPIDARFVPATTPTTETIVPLSRTTSPEPTSFTLSPIFEPELDID